MSTGAVACKLANIATTFYYDVTPTPLRNLMRSTGCTLHGLPESVTLESDILEHKAVVTVTKQTANTSDFVKVVSSNVRNYNKLLLQS